MSHQPYQEWMHQALDGRLAEAQRADLRAHLAECAACAAAWVDLQQVDQWLARPALAGPRPGFTGRFQARLRQRRAHPRAVWGAVVLGFGTLSLASLLLPAGLGLLWSLAQMLGQPAASAALLDNASSVSQVALTLFNALALTLKSVGAAALVSPLAWGAALAALAAAGLWIMVISRLTLQGFRS